MTEKPKRQKPPSYRRRKVRGQDVAYVTLRDVHSKRRQDFWLGDYGSDASRQLYIRLVTEWEANGRRLVLAPDTRSRPTVRRDELRICELGLKYYTWCQASMSAGDIRAVHSAIRLLNQHYGDEPAAAFGPNALRLVREAMIQGNPEADPPRRAWSRITCTAQTKRIVAMFKWAAARELVPASIHQALRMLEPLRAGRSAAVESEPVTPAPIQDVEAVLELANKQIAAMIRLQLLTGMRPGEVCAMRRCDIDVSGPVWVYRPRSHKTAHLGKGRMIAIGPQAQRILASFVEGRMPAAHLFSPAEAEAARRAQLSESRKTPQSCGNRPGTNRRENPLRYPADAYTPASYRRAITRLCDAADARERQRRLKAGERIEANVRFVRTWHPHQLRHNAATEIRKRFGLEAARLMLGHSSALITDAVYAERDEAALLKIAAAIA